ncbi:flippase-like domain-containing protein, partial [Candidatus Pacearchaeota archaeon]|nr:flippase-like domain-containing protein [Candidatus Pacearchaeota archaeon]
LQSWRFRVVMQKCANIKLPFWPWLKIYILARFLNTVFSQAGNVYRSLKLKRDYGVSHTKYIGGHTSMAWLDLLMNLSMALIVVLFVRPDFTIGRFTAWKLLATLIPAIAAAPPLVEIFIRKLSFRNKKLLWVHQRLHEVVTTTANNLKSPGYLLKIFLIGTLLFIRTCIVFYIFFLCFGVKVDLPTLAVFYAMFKLSSFVTITPGNIGIQELVWGILSESMGIGMAQGVLVSALIRVVGTCFIFILGTTCGGLDLVRHRKEYTSSKEVS